ncbi:MAG TPA: T9SS type A sorting domain-containing protein, partial [Candidatus Marinimicrobia bacterium]|nr:T9SS type A sorting domain-containing protein [Candidatus Neomarinimicrobiota bacterium]
PFNPVTNITFGIESDGLVSVKVFDVTGREIADLANGVYSVGYHIIDWDASNSPSGMYFLKAEFGGITETQKLMLIK